MPLLCGFKEPLERFFSIFANARSVSVTYSQIVLALITALRRCFHVPLERFAIVPHCAQTVSKLVLRDGTILLCKVEP